MSICSRCGARFGCAMADGGDQPCWCTALPAAVPVPGQGAVPVPGQGAARVPGQAACWCPACLMQHIAELGRLRSPVVD